MTCVLLKRYRIVAVRVCRHEASLTAVLSGFWKLEAKQYGNMPNKQKGKAPPITGRGGPLGCEPSRLPHFLDNRFTDGGKVASLTRLPPFTPQEDSWYLFLLDPRAIVRLEGLGKLKKRIHDLIGNRTRDLPACSRVLQPTTLPLVP
jgi:hypothetical protein